MEMLGTAKLITVLILISCACAQHTADNQTVCTKLQYNISTDLGLLWNVTTLHNVDRIFFLVFCPFLFIAQVFTIIVFIRYPSLLIKPGNIFFVLVLIEIGLNLHLFTTAIYHSIYTYSQFPSIPSHYISACQGLGIINTFFQTNHLFYLFIFPFYIIFLFKFSLKKKSDNFWRLLHGAAALVCAGLTVYFYFQQFIGLNIYGLCGLTTLLNPGKHLNWNLIMPSFQIFYSLCFFFIGLFTYRYFRKHMPQQGQLKQRKIKNSQIILLFVTGFSIFQFFMSATSLAMAIDCQENNQLNIIISLVTVINIIRLFQFTFTIFLILWNGRFRIKFKHTIKYLFVKNKSSVRKVSDSFELDRTNQIQMEQIMFNQKLLKLKDKSNQIDLLFVSQIYTILSGVYAIFFEYFQQKNLYDSAHDDQIKPINFKQSITIQIDNQSLKNCQFQTRLLLKLKLLKCTFTLHSPKFFRRLLRLDGLEHVHQSFKIMDNVKKIWNLADGQGGKSGEFFFFSADRKFVLKTITIQQFAFLKKNLQFFYEYYKQNPKSVLAKIYGLFTIKGDQMQNTYRLILMKNITGCDQKQILRVYDLKGSKYDREVVKSGDVQPNQLEKITLKDLDFIKYEGKVKINIEKSNGLRQVLRKDSSFLKQLQLIDYSLLLIRVKWEKQPIFSDFWGDFQRIPHEQNKSQYYHIGIIDYLQLWDFQKKSESWWKKFLGKKDISAIDPKNYSLRFINFVDEIVNSNIKSFSYDNILNQKDEEDKRKRLTAGQIKLFSHIKQRDPEYKLEQSQQSQKYDCSKQESPAFTL